MRGFMIICLASVVLAAPQYNYQPSASSFVGESAAPASGYAASAPPSFAPAPAAPSFAPAPAAPSFAPAPAAQSFAPAPAAQSFAPAPAAQGIVNKQFYIHSAPEDALGEGANLNQDSSSSSKSLRVVIIKAPENNGLQNAALQLAKSASDSQTAIYVLNKQTDVSALQQKLQQLQGTDANKPEVHFVKYRTPEEAQYAQQAIQSQYNSLPGPSQVSDEGVAPVENYVGSAGGSGGGGFGGAASGGGGGGFGGGQQGGFEGHSAGGGSVSNKYLPAVQPAASNNYPSVSNTYLPVKRL